MSKSPESNVVDNMRLLDDMELDAVIGGGLVGYGSLGTKFNISPWSINASHDPMWDLVGITGYLPN